jgi:hypothetical protein
VFEEEECSDKGGEERGGVGCLRRGMLLPCLSALRNTGVEDVFVTYVGRSKQVRPQMQ